MNKFTGFPGNDAVKEMIDGQLKWVILICCPSLTYRDYIWIRKNLPPLEVKDHKLESKDYLDDFLIQDFPLRGMASFLHLRRRK